MNKTLQPNHIYWRGGIAYRYLGQCNVISDDTEVGVRHVAVPLHESNPVITAALAEDLMLGREVRWKPKRSQRTVRVGNQEYTVVQPGADQLPDPESMAVVDALTKLASRSRKFTYTCFNKVAHALRATNGNVSRATRELKDMGVDISPFTVTSVLRAVRDIK
jgi:hypothetical protein